MFNAKGSLFCEYDVTWCFFVSMWEEDLSILINTDDLIGKEGIKCITDKYSFDYLIEGLQYSDGPFDNFYEIYITVTHNCTQGDLKQVTQETSLESIFSRITMPACALQYYSFPEDTMNGNPIATQTKVCDMRDVILTDKARVHKQSKRMVRPS
ncbi:hypothetical protein B9Z55_026381 [Caenorhabditis nigoni]|nr:hypothetical protein B9Z55_026381 [Caenorhabditis nigoni]